MEKQTQEENKSLPIDAKTILLKALQEIVRKLSPIRQDHICNDICTIAENAIKEYRNLPNDGDKTLVRCTACGSIMEDGECKRCIDEINSDDNF